MQKLLAFFNKKKKAVLENLTSHKPTKLLVLNYWALNVYHIFSDSFKDVYPCDNWQLKEKAWDECRWTINDMLIHLTPDEQNNYNVSPENCRSV